MRLFEVGPRDGLQNEDMLLSVEQKLSMIARLVEAGARDIEVGSFVHPKWVPQMANTDELAAQLERKPGVRYWALVPNLRGLERALQANIEHIAIFGSASETHSQKNINRSIEESMTIFEEVVEQARAEDMTVRAYISMAFGCPYEGDIEFARVLEQAQRYFDWGVDHVSLGDTTGMGKPLQIRANMKQAIDQLGVERVALHLHDTRGMGLTNAFVAYEAGVRFFDCSVGGIGGCPYAPGAAGNLGSEDLLYLLESIGADPEYSLEQVNAVSHWLEEETGIHIPSRCHRYLESADNPLSCYI